MSRPTGRSGGKSAGRLAGTAPPSPLSLDEFAPSLDALGPFEDRPELAVAVSGGADSMALLLLAADWAAGCGGTLTALTVDHGLRPEAAAEARRVAGWCAALGIPHQALVWQGAKPASGIQEAARAARYDLLCGWCRSRAVAHLLLGHHAEDQAETFLYRMSRGSGVDGLAAMPAAAARGGVRLLRPLLAHRKARLEALLQAAGQDWVEDPSNRDRRYARVALRDSLAVLEESGVGVAPMLTAAGALGRLRADEECRRARFLADCAAIHPEGHAEIAPGAFGDVPADLAGAALAALLAAVGGRAFSPRRQRLDALLADIRAGGPARPRTLGGCVVSRRDGGLRLWREPRAVREHLALPSGGARGEKSHDLRWDRRFDLAAAPQGGRGGDLAVARLGEAGWQAISGEADAIAETRGIPGPVLFSLPALWRGGTVEEVPHLGWRRADRGAPVLVFARFRPEKPVAGVPFRVA